MASPVRSYVRFGVVSHRRAEESIGPLLGEPARAGKDHWYLEVADSKSAEHVRQPRAAARLSSEEVGVVTLDDNRRPGDLGQALHLKGVRFENHVEGSNGRMTSGQPACDLRRFDPIS